MDNLEWLTRNSLRSFPVVEDAHSVSLNTGWKLPDFLIADALILVESEPAGVYVQSVTISSMIIAVVLGSVQTGRALGTVSTIRGQDDEFARKPIAPLIPGVSGFVTFGSALSDERFRELQDHVGMHLFPTSVVLEGRSVMNVGPFPVRSIGRSISMLSGAVSISTNSAMTFQISQGVHNGDPMQIVTMALANPGAFLSPCENPTTQCECPTVPIGSINGVLPDGSGVIHLELVDASGNVYAMAPSVLSFLLTRTGDSLCNRPAMPDAYGRLPLPSGYSSDEKPITPYKAVGDDTFPSPVQ